MRYHLEIIVNISLRFFHGLCLGVGLDPKETKKVVTETMNLCLKSVPREFGYPGDVNVKATVQWWAEITAEDGWPSKEPMKIVLNLYDADDAARPRRMAPWVSRSAVKQKIEGTWEELFEIP